MLTLSHRYRAEIDGVRGLAILAVLVYHYFPGLLPGGFAGVDVFFVVSGYLVGAQVVIARQSGTFSWADFLARRARRLFPALSLVIGVCLAAGGLFLFPGEFLKLGQEAWQGAGFIANFGYLGHVGYFQATQGSQILLHLWSLAVEEQFYVFWPAILLLGSILRLSAGVSLLIVWIISFALCLLTTSEHPQLAFYLPHTRIWEFLAGTGLALRSELIAGRLSAKGKEIISWVGLIVMIGALFLLNNSMTWPGAWAAWPVAGAVLSLTAGGASRLNRSLLGSRALSGLGRISYSLYLWHWPVIVFARELLGEPLSLWIKFCLAVFALILAILTTRWIERPMRYGGGVKTLRVKSLGATAALFLVALAAAGVVATDGVAGRYSTEVSAASLFDYKYLEKYREGSCFIARVEHYNRALDFSPACIEGDQAAPLVVLWGDSHAAHLYPALAAVVRARAQRLAQFTVSTCPPVIDYHQAWCDRVNRITAERISALRADTVILAANWSLYGDSGLPERTVALLRAQGVRRIVLVGSVPLWPRPLPKIVRDTLLARPGAAVPARLRPDGLKESRIVDEKISALAMRLGTEFVSPLARLCDESGCMVHTGNGISSLVAWDYGHLTSEGSRVLIGSGELFLGRWPLQ